MVSRIAFWYMSQFAMPGRPFGRVGSAVKEGEAEEGLPAPRHDKGEGRGRMQLRVDIQVHQGKGGYEGCLTLVKYECERVAGERLLQATMRFETAPGVQAQIDWKESMTLR